MTTLLSLSAKLDQVLANQAQLAALLVHPAQTQRLWSADSAWNQVIPAGIPTDPRSAAQWGWIAANYWPKPGADFMTLSGIDPNYGAYGVPKWAADATTPTVKVAPSTTWWGGFTAMPMPAGAHASLSTDGHLAVADLVKRISWELYQAKSTATGWSAGAGITFGLDGLGYLTGPYPVGMTSARAYGGSLIAGLVTYEDVIAGSINHALAVCVPNQRYQSHAQGLAIGNPLWHVANANPGGHPEFDTDDRFPDGARIQLLMSPAEIAASGWDWTTQMIATALATFGGIVVDGSGAFGIFTETLQGGVRSWLNLLASSAATVLPRDLARWRTLIMPTLTAS